MENRTKLLNVTFKHSMALATVCLHEVILLFVYALFVTAIIK